MIVNTSTPRPLCMRYQAISLLFSNDLWLFNWLLDGSRRHLNGTAADLVREASFFDPEIEVLALLAVCIWTERGLWPVSNAYQFLSDFRFESVILALEVLRGPTSNSCLCDICKEGVEHAMGAPFLFNNNG